VCCLAYFICVQTALLQMYILPRPLIFLPTLLLRAPPSVYSVMRCTQGFIPCSPSLSLTTERALSSCSLCLSLRTVLFLRHAMRLGNQIRVLVYVGLQIRSVQESKQTDPCSDQTDQENSCTRYVLPPPPQPPRLLLRWRLLQSTGISAHSTPHQTHHDGRQQLHQHRHPQQQTAAIDCGAWGAVPPDLGKTPGPAVAGGLKGWWEWGQSLLARIDLSDLARQNGAGRAGGGRLTTPDECTTSHQQSTHLVLSSKPDLYQIRDRRCMQQPAVF